LAVFQVRFLCPDAVPVAVALDPCECKKSGLRDQAANAWAPLRLRVVHDHGPCRQLKHPKQIIVLAQVFSAPLWLSARPFAFANSAWVFLRVVVLDHLPLPIG
jgi:hypothetical protein